MRRTHVSPLETSTQFTPTADGDDDLHRLALEVHTRLRYGEDLLLDQYSLFHNLHARESWWFNTFSILIIVSSSLMTFLSALSFIMSEEMVTQGYDKIPNLCLSFLTTLLCSVLKYFDFQQKLTSTREGAQQTQIAIKELEVARDRLETNILSSIPIQPKIVGSARRAITAGLRSYHQNKQFLIALSPDLILSFEKEHQLRSLRRQKRTISSDISRLFQKTVDRLRRTYGQQQEGDTTESLMEKIKELLGAHNQLLVQHDHLLAYASDFDTTLRREALERAAGCWTRLWQRMTLLWWTLCCRCRMCRPRVYEGRANVY